MTIIEDEKYYCIQVSFERDINNYNIIKLVNEKIEAIVSTKGNKDLYLNINAYIRICCKYKGTEDVSEKWICSECFLYRKHL